jgi:hypothetical protein
VPATAAWLGRLIEPKQVVELRAIYCDGYARTCYFRHDQLDTMAREAVKLTEQGEVKGVYWTLNPVEPGPRGRSPGTAGASRAACSSDIVRRRWLLVDLDPVRPANTSATADEKQRAEAVSHRVRDYLAGRGWPAPVFADSGNGFHLLYRVDLPSNDQGLIKRVLLALAHRFDDGGVTVDTHVADPARVCRLYGTMARKGEATAERPHRWTGVLGLPSHLKPVSATQLEHLAAEGPSHSSRAAIQTEPTTTRPGVDNRARDGVLRRARAFVARMPEAVSGRGGTTLPSGSPRRWSSASD